MNRKAAHNSTYPKGGVSCPKDSFVVNQTLVFQIKICGKSPALRVAAKRCASASKTIIVIKSLLVFLFMETFSIFGTLNNCCNQ
jgi:hypothetical protein